MGLTRQVFPEAFKREAVERVMTSGLSAGAAAQELGLHETMLRRWMVTFGMQATGGGEARQHASAVPVPGGFGLCERPTAG